MSEYRTAAQRGMDCQRRAMSVFQSGRFQDAYDLYIEAESLYRKALDAGEDWVTTRLFFMQSSALRCLEQLMEDTPGLLSTYRSTAEKFLDDWPTAKISKEIHHERVHESLAFRAWRESYLDGVDDFSAAAAARKAGDLTNARKILEAFIERTRQSGGVETDALVALARSKIEMLPTQQELQKRPQERNTRIVATGYLRAAKVSRLPANSHSKQHNRFTAFRYWFLCNALKFRAFEELRQMDVPRPSLIKAERFLKRAVKHARKAVSLGEFPRDHPVYLEYWHEIIAERMHLLAFMNHGNPNDYDNAVKAWQNSLKMAEQLCEHSGEDSVFPNRFYCIVDLRLEGGFLAAAKAFRESRWSDCVQFLENWREGLPPEFKWSWRDVNVQIRLLGAKTIDAIVSGNKEMLPSLCRELIDLSKSEPAGGAAKRFASEITRLREKAKNTTLFELTLDSVGQYFPLDSWVDSYEDNLDRLASLPEKIYHNFSMGVRTFEEAEAERSKRAIAGAIEAFLGYMCDYYAQASTPSSTVPKPNIHELVNRCRNISFRWAQRPTFQNLINELHTGIDKLLSTSDVETLNVIYDNMRYALHQLVHFFPVKVELRSTVLRHEPPVDALDVFPDWALDRTGRQMLYVFVSPKDLSGLTPGKYYMKPGWRKANRLSYRVDKEHPFYPVRFVPRWDYWQTESANASFFFSEGVLLEHARAAIELSKSCTDNLIKPKVGAVIVKERRIISKAYRGEDGSDRHAEEIAIGKCTRDQLRGAIMVTTLEPCSAHGRSTREVSCADRILLTRFSKVIIGIPDPDKRIQGWGDKQLRENDIAIAYFPSALSQEIRELNEQFILDRTKDDFEKGTFAKI